MIYRKICEFCSECRPSSRELRLIDVFICCGSCVSKIYKRYCDLCGKNTYIYGIDSICIHCRKYTRDISLETPIR